jgi:hypothetical protein
MDNVIIPILIGTAFILFIVFGYYYNDKQQILRELKKSRRKTISQVREREYAKVVGKAKHVSEPLIAPISGRPCVYYEVLVEKYRDDSWDSVIEDSKSQDFFIENNSELAIVKAALEEDAEDFRRVHLVKDHERGSGFMNNASHKLEAYLAQHNKSSTGFLGFNKTLRYKEGIIALNETVAVKGIAKWKALNEPVDGYSYSRILTFEGSAEQKLLITDEPKAMKKVSRKL